MSAWSFVENAVLVSSLEFLHNLGFSVPADGLDELTLLVFSARVGSFLESLDDGGTLHVSGPGASGESVERSSVSDAALSLSHELSDNSGLDEVL